jgi:hypothetical protein
VGGFSRFDKLKNKKMKIEIEDYKGQTIYYDDNSDKFECSIELNNNVKTSKRDSLQDLRKEIDLFIKANIEFKPFKFLMKSQYGGNSFSLYECSAIRTDGKFVISQVGSTYKSYAGKKESALFMKLDNELFERLNQIVKEIEDLRVKSNNEIKELCDKLIPLDLSMFDLK